MTESEATQMVELLRSAWDEPLTDADAGEASKLFGAYAPDTVAQVIADCREAEQPRPSRADLSRLLRAYAPGSTGSDRPPEPPKRAWKQAPGPFLDEVEPAPDLKAHLAAARTGLEAGIQAGAEARKARLGMCREESNK